MIVWRLPPKAVQTDRHHSSIAPSRSGPAGTASTSATRHAASILRQMHIRPPSFSPPEFHVRFLGLTSRKPLFNLEVKAHQAEQNADRTAVGGCGLHPKRVCHKLQNKSGVAHGVDLHLFIRSTQCIHVENSILKKWSTFDRIGGTKTRAG